jgi:hypothetical protein
MMRSETPLPIPFSVISSPSHIRKIVPAVIVTIIENFTKRVGFGKTGTPLTERFCKKTENEVE